MKKVLTALGAPLVFALAAAPADAGSRVYHCGGFGSYTSGIVLNMTGYYLKPVHVVYRQSDRPAVYGVETGCTVPETVTAAQATGYPVKPRFAHRIHVYLREGSGYGGPGGTAWTRTGDLGVWRYTWSTRNGVTYFRATNRGELVTFHYERGVTPPYNKATSGPLSDLP